MATSFIDCFEESLTQLEKRWSSSTKRRRPRVELAEVTSNEAPRESKQKAAFAKYPSYAPPPPPPPAPPSWLISSEEINDENRSCWSPPPPPPPAARKSADPKRLEALATPRTRLNTASAVDTPHRVQAASPKVKTRVELERAAARLHDDAMARKIALETRRQSLQHEREHQQAQQMHQSRSVKPAPTNIRSSALPPIQDRAKDILAEREAALAKAREEIRMREEAALKMNRTVLESFPVERLNGEAKSREDRLRLARLEALRVESATVCYGKPRIDPRSRSLVGEAHAPLSERAQDLAKELEEKRKVQVLNQRMKEERELEEKRRRPQARVADPRRVSERLHQDDPKKSYAQTRLVNDYYDSFTFAPSINPTSRALAPLGTGGVDALYQEGSERQRRLEEARAEAQRLELERECPFRPKVESEQPSADVLEFIEQRRREKARMASWEKELKETSECTFRPKPSQPPPPSFRREEAKLRTKGFDAYLERQAFAKELKNEMKARQEKAFGAYPSRWD